MEVELNHPFSMLVSRGRGAGKTNFTKSLLKHRETILLPSPKRIVWCYAKYQLDLLQELLFIDQTIEYIQEIPSDVETIFDWNTNGAKYTFF